MSTLFRRAINVTVGTLALKGLDCTFSITKTLKPEPNTCELRIFNMTESHRLELEGLKTDVPVQVDAGYVDQVSTLFLGNLRRGYSYRDGPDIVTEVSTGDGEKAHRTARVNVSVPKNATSKDVLKQVASALGVLPGNLDQAAALLAANQVFTQGTVISGNAAREMTAICRSLGLTWSIQDGKLQIIQLGKALAGSAVSLSAATGLIGQPSVDNDGIMSATMLITPDVFPGRKLVLDSLRLKGQYVLQSCKYSGDTNSEEWFINVEGKRY